jgi:quercetin dioxygenase-like cupin family protein
VKVWRSSEREPVPTNDTTHFRGDVRRSPVGAPGDGVGGRATIVHFMNGAHTKRHSHGDGQLLVIVSGKGFVETEGERVEIEAGNVIVCPPGEIHRHGALPGQNMAHMTVSGGEATWLGD